MKFLQITPHPNYKQIPIKTDPDKARIRCLYGNGLSQEVFNMIARLVRLMGDRAIELTQDQGAEICGESAHEVFARCNNETINKTIYTNWGLENTKVYLKDERLIGESYEYNDIGYKLRMRGCQLEEGVDSGYGVSVAIGITVLACTFIGLCVLIIAPRIRSLGANSGGASDERSSGLLPR